MIGPAADAVFQAAGSGLAVLYFVYTVFFLALGIVFLHWWLLVYLVASMWKPRLRVRIIMLLAELLYGLVNPLIYLMIIEHSWLVQREWVPLSLAAWSLLVLIWGSRFTLGLDPFRRSRAARQSSTSHTGTSPRRSRASSSAR